MTHHASVIPRGRHASRLSVEDRFWLRVKKTETCWLWRDPSAARAYGKFTASNGRSVGAHRFAYELLVGPIPDGLELDHIRDLCSSRACVKVIADEFGPAHLEPVTGRENKLRGDTVNARNAAKTQCVNGHDFDKANTFFRPTGGRSCRACHRDVQRRYLEARRASY